LCAEEKARVQKAGGQVVKWMNGVDRVFVPGKHEPGLAVARAFGELDLKSHGLIVSPVVRVHDIKLSDEFAVLCSDGVRLRCALAFGNVTTARLSVLVLICTLATSLMPCAHSEYPMSYSCAGLGRDVESRGG